MGFNFGKAQKKTAQLTEKGSHKFEAGETAVIIVATDPEEGEYFREYQSFDQKAVQTAFGVTGSTLCLDPEGRFAKIGLLEKLGYPSDMKFCPVKTLVQKLKIKIKQDDKVSPAYAKTTYNILIIPVAHRSVRPNGKVGSWEAISTGTNVKAMRAKMGKNKNHIMGQLSSLLQKTKGAGIVCADTDFSKPQKCFVIGREGVEHLNTEYKIQEELVSLDLSKYDIDVSGLNAEIEEAIKDYSPVQPETVNQNMILSAVNLTAIAEGHGINNLLDLACGRVATSSESSSSDSEVESESEESDGSEVDVEASGDDVDVETEASEDDVEEDTPF